MTPTDDDYPIYISDGRPYAKTGRTLEVIPGALNVDYGPTGDMIGVEILAPLDDVAARIAQLEEATRWRDPVTEPPQFIRGRGYATQKTDDVLFLAMCKQYIGHYCYTQDARQYWVTRDTWREFEPSEVTGWMPLPSVEGT